MHAQERDPEPNLVMTMKQNKERKQKTKKQ